MQTSDGGNIVSALGICVEKVVQIFFYYLFNPFVWLFSLVFKDKIDTITQHLAHYIKVSYLYIGGAIMVYLLYLPVAYALNAGAPDRLIAFIGFFALIFSIFYICSILDWSCIKKVSRTYIFIIATIASISGAYYFVEPLRIALFTLNSGPEFHKEHEKRAEYIRSQVKNGHHTISVKPIARNRLLLFEDLRMKSDNEQYARYFGAESITLDNFR